ncbi:hypothetical protein BDF20DRAFT_830944 [Mycotypha africana]|uniref:uncharacterized protein n=1 Tax=Mycotypha africana TaxID=64632 RepID=UPI002301B2F3|nr:uncharacterized protein BDF20DRAFT_830944 [Mycotypha africana]KAI8990853.1 hypothetical protein BDF20DRAFT_830944 [Mycotypha africana]
MPPPLNSFSTLLSTKAKPFASKAIGRPISTNVLRQQQQQQQQQQQAPYVAPALNNSSVTKKPIITETSVLNTFPRPNLQPTLLNSQCFTLQAMKALAPLQTCFNCSGPHSTEFCPC